MKAPSYQFQPITSPEPKKPSLVIAAGIGVVALVVLIIAFFTGGDAATGVSRTGLAAIVIGVLGIIAGISGLTMRRALAGLPNLVLLGLGALLSALGIGGVLMEAPLHTSQGDSYQKSGSYLQAVNEYRKGGSVNLTSKIPESYMQLADQQVTLKSFPQAIENYKLVSTSELMPNQYSGNAKKQIAATYVLWGAQLESDSSKSGDALAKYDEAIKDGSNPEAVIKAKGQAQALIFRLGDSQLQAGKFQEALNTYQKAASSYGASADDLKPFVSKTYLTWGKNLLAASDFEGALGKLESNLATAAASDLNDYNAAIVDSYASIGNKLLSDKKIDEAIAKITPAYTTYQKVDSANKLTGLLLTGYNGQGGTFEAAKDLPKAIASYEKALTFAASDNTAKDNLNASLVRVYLGQGDVLLGANNFGQALASFNKALTFAGNNADAKGQVNGRLFNLYVLQSEQAVAANDVDKAIENYEKSLTYIAAGSEASNNIVGRLGNLYLAKGAAFIGQSQFSEAILYLRDKSGRYAKTPVEGAFRTTTAKAYLGWADQAEKAGSFQTALDRYRLILKDYSDQPAYTSPASDAQSRVIFSWASKLAADNDYDNAIKRYQEVIDGYGASPFASQARTLLTAPQAVIVTVTSNGAPVANTKIKLYESWSFLPTSGFDSTGRELEFTTDASGNFMVQLAPGKNWMLAYFDGGSFVTISVKRNEIKTAANLVSTKPLRATTMKQDVGI